MRRRDFIARLGGAAAWPLAARAQRNGRTPHVGVLMAHSETDQGAQARLQVFRQSLANFGWVEGREIRIDVRWAGPDVARSRTMRANLLLSPPM
jgi:putative tryptophan/tyrosine transport system substrate-binding protein